MTGEYELVAKRVSKMSDNHECSPLDLLKTVIHHIEIGETPCDAVYVITLKRLEKGKWDISRYRAQLSPEETIALLRSAEYKTMKSWSE